MKSIKKHQVKTFIFFFLLTATSYMMSNKESNANALGLSVGTQLELIDDIFVNKNLKVAKDHIFVGADAFANYYGDDIISYNYGFQGSLGYKIINASVYGLAGIQHAGFGSNQSQNFKKSSSPIYGFGVGYDFPLLNMGVRLNNTFFNLERKDGSKNNFSIINVGIVFLF